MRKINHTSRLTASDISYLGSDTLEFYYPSKAESLPDIRSMLVNTPLPKILDSYDQLIITNKTDLAVFKAYVAQRGIYLSTSNKKVMIAGKKNGYERPVAFGKTTIATCLYASEECKLSCYQLKNRYPGSENCHLYNSLIMANLTFDEIYNAIELTLSTMDPDLIRLLDNGDMSQPAEYVVWDKIARNHPNIRIYGYTKGAEMLNMASDNLTGSVVWNLSDNGDMASKKWTTILHDTGSYKVCHIRYTTEYDHSQPFNNEESVAIMTREEMINKFNTDEFQIGFHGSEYPDVDRFYHNLGIQLQASQNIRVC